MSNSVIARQEWYSAIYENTHPKPQKKEISFLGELGMDAMTLVIAVVGAVIASAVRTTTIFMLSELLLLEEFLLIQL